MLDKPLGLWHCPFAQLPPCSEADLDRNTSCGKVCAELCLFLKHEGSFVCKGDMFLSTDDQIWGQGVTIGCRLNVSSIHETSERGKA